MHRRRPDPTRTRPRRTRKLNRPHVPADQRNERREPLRAIHATEELLRDVGAWAYP